MKLTKFVVRKKKQICCKDFEGYRKDCVDHSFEKNVLSYVCVCVHVFSFLSILILIL